MQAEACELEKPESTTSWRWASCTKHNWNGLHICFSRQKKDWSTIFYIDYLILKVVTLKDDYAILCMNQYIDLLDGALIF